METEREIAHVREDLEKLRARIADFESVRATILSRLDSEALDEKVRAKLLDQLAVTETELAQDDTTLRGLQDQLSRQEESVQKQRFLKDVSKATAEVPLSPWKSGPHAKKSEKKREKIETKGEEGEVVEEHLTDTHQFVLVPTKGDKPYLTIGPVVSSTGYVLMPRPVADKGYEFAPVLSRPYMPLSGQITFDQASYASPTQLDHFMKGLSDVFNDRSNGWKIRVQDAICLFFAQNTTSDKLDQGLKIVYYHEDKAHIATVAQLRAIAKPTLRSIMRYFADYTAELLQQTNIVTKFALRHSFPPNWVHWAFDYALYCTDIPFSVRVVLNRLASSNLSKQEPLQVPLETGFYQTED